jgi:hypothetical protein
MKSKLANTIYYSLWVHYALLKLGYPEGGPNKRKEWKRIVMKLLIPIQVCAAMKNRHL